ncbi:ATP-binding protein [Haliscomenobacter hydrossis]|uniref:histidine kinase n=1 Tax=Haliscomenobacter hydrossis (strain ATCC 27775 / DSM 1100 / LMG 10767 / O) TaxID=760192 RepID=F4KRZ7_HALH1|nr:ATP-binding protein [Haliscomenobacter hydrossis]AEE51084.1 histidine kinase [Haliscomenobacter hydrossis DSM 1100]
MSKVSFSVSARTAKLIGQENFANAEGAIVELVKNGYDADAKNCIIIFQNHGHFADAPTIYIVDNGVGMDGEVIKNNWMKIGTDDKLENYLSEGGRVKTGAKGIGRFALDRLGLSSEMYTVSKEPIEGSIWKVEWSDFDRSGIAIHEVEADLENDNNLDLQSELQSQFNEFAPIANLLDDIDFSSGTILKINSLKDSWDEKTIKSLFDNLEVLIPPKEQPEFSVHLFSTGKPTDYGLVNSAYYDDFDYKISAKYSAGEAHNLEIIITRNELDNKVLEEEYSEIFEMELMKTYPYDLKTFHKKSFVLNKKLEELPGFSNVEKDLINQIGEFDFTFYFLKRKIDINDEKRFPYKSISPANRRSWLNKFGGVKIFRDDFRVRPYGEDGQDWLNLGKRQARSPGGPGQKLGGYKIGPDQIAGTVSISRISNASFQDKSGREGIQENDAFNLFINILVEIIALFERDRNIVMYCLSELAKKRFKDEEDKRKAQEEANKILEEETKSRESGESNESRTGESGSSEGQSTERERLFARTTKMFEQEIEEKNEEIRFLRGLASVGLIVSSFAHELQSLKARLVPRTDFLLREMKKYIHEKDLITVHREENPFYMVQLIKDEDQKLRHWLEYSLSSLKRDKRTRTNINIGDYFEKFQAIWSNALKQRRVKVILKGTKNPSNVIRAFEVDLDAIFNNLLSNSLTAFKQRKGIYEKEVSIDWKVKNNSIEITFTDNGCGLATEYQSEPQRIFEYNESSKRDKKGNKIGTGMGLYIVKLVVEDHNGASIKLLQVKEGFSVGISLPLRT